MSKPAKQRMTGYKLTVQDAKTLQKFAILQRLQLTPDAARKIEAELASAQRA